MSLADHRTDVVILCAENLTVLIYGFIIEPCSFRLHFWKQQECDEWLDLVYAVCIWSTVPALGFDPEALEEADTE